MLHLARFLATLAALTQRIYPVFRPFDRVENLPARRQDGFGLVEQTPRLPAAKAVAGADMRPDSGEEAALALRQ